MIALVCLIWSVLIGPFKSRSRLEVENAALRCGSARGPEADRRGVTVSAPFKLMIWQCHILALGVKIRSVFTVVTARIRKSEVLIASAGEFEIGAVPWRSRPIRCLKPDILDSPPDWSPDSNYSGARDAQE
jgi:hypothetical protein